MFAFKFCMERLLCRKDRYHWDTERLIILARVLFLRSW